MNIEIFIISGFLAINLIIGLFFSGGIKNIKEYALGNRNFSTATIVATIVATWMAGSNIPLTISETYNNGLYFLIPGLADSISFFIIAYFYAPRMAEFLGNLSVAETMGKLYGPKARLITATSAILIGVGNVAMQFAVSISLVSYVFGVSSVYAMIISSLIVIIYSSYGGIKAVTFTDMVQFFTFCITIPMTAFFIWKAVDNNSAILNVLTNNPLFNYKEVLSYDNPRILNTVTLFLFFLIPAVDPIIFQRISMARNINQVMRSFAIAGSIMLVLEFGIIAFCSVMLLASQHTGLDEHNIISHILDHYMSGAFKGFFIVGILAMIMSTADSYINSSAILFSHDALGAFGVKLTDKKQLLLVRITSFIIGLSALLLSLWGKSLMELIMFTYGFYMPIVSVPLILAIFGFRSTTKAVLIGMFAAFVMVITLRILTNVDPLIPGMMINALFFISSPYILRQKGGWSSITSNPQINIIRQERKRTLHKMMQSIKTSNILKLCRLNFPKDESIIVYFGFFCMITIFSHAFALPKLLNRQYESILNPIYFSVLTLSTLFITYPLWSEKIKNYTLTPVLWNVAIFYNLAFCNTLLTIIGEFNQVQVAVLITCLVSVAVLLRWQMALFIIISGVVFSIQCYKTYSGIDSLPAYTNSLQFKITYCLLLISSILVTFFKPKQQYQELTEESNLFLSDKLEYQKKELIQLQALKNEFLRNMAHETHTPISDITNMGQLLWENYDKLTAEEKRQATADIAASSERLNSLVNNIVDLAKLENLDDKLTKSKVNISQLVEDRVAICRKLYYQENNTSFVLEIAEGLHASCDGYYLAKAIDNIVINAIQYCKDGQITISLCQDGGNKVQFSVKDEGIGIPKHDLDDVFGAFVVSSRTKTSAGGRGVGLALAKKVIDLHKGKIWAKANLDKGVTFSFILFTAP
jgi:Na+/proline symporter